MVPLVHHEKQKVLNLVDPLHKEIRVKDDLAVPKIDHRSRALFRELEMGNVSPQNREVFVAPHTLEILVEDEVV